MIDTDLKRLGEAFCATIGNEDSELSLSGFARHAFSEFNERYLNRKLAPDARDFYYPGKNGAELVLRVSSDFLPDNLVQPELIGIRIENVATHSLEHLLKLQRGYLTAEFSDFRTQDLDESTRKLFLQKRKDNYSNALSAGLYFNGQSSDEIKQLILERKSRWLGFYTGTTQLKIEEVLDRDLIDILKKSSRITINNSEHFRKDSDLPLYNELCQISRTNAGYSWLYRIETPNKKPLPTELCQRLKQICELALKNFDLRSFKRLRIKNPDEIN